ncbi:MAG: hypothetical protein GKR87_03810 [Kiritimatiellae bacterium]|nr:hypothetical protein [Kiritimatiellia bacterium]
MYDTANRKQVLTDAKSNTVTYTYDVNNNMVQIDEVEKSDLGNPDQLFTTTYDYDHLDRRIKSIDNVTNTIEYAYDSRNNGTRMTDALGNVTRHEYDGLNRLVKTIRDLTDDGTGNGVVIDAIAIEQVWDDSSRLVSMTDDNTNTTSYAYDALDRKRSATYADGTVHSQTYDIYDNITQRIDANGSIVSNLSDDLDRVTLRSIVPGVGVSSNTAFKIYQYDGLSRLVYAQDDDSAITRSYDSLSHAIEEVLNG